MVCRKLGSKESAKKKNQIKKDGPTHEHTGRPIRFVTMTIKHTLGYNKASYEQTYATCMYALISNRPHAYACNAMKKMLKFLTVAVNAAATTTPLPPPELTNNS